MNIGGYGNRNTYTAVPLFLVIFPSHQYTTLEGDQHFAVSMDGLSVSISSKKDSRMPGGVKTSLPASLLSDGPPQPSYSLFRAALNERRYRLVEKILLTTAPSLPIGDR